MNLLPPAVEKTVNEGSCRVCTKTDLQTAHLWPRGRGAPKYDEPDICIPLCVDHHTRFDRHELDILPYLSLDEQVATVKAAGGIQRAYDQLTGKQWEAPAPGPLF